MINSVKINLLKKFIILIENIQALTNNDIYSIVRIKKYNNLKLFLDNNFSKAYVQWKKNYKYLKRDLLLLHNISYNHWIRSYIAKNITRKNKFLNFLCYLGIFKNFILLILFYIKVKNSKIKFHNKISNINNKNILDEFQFQFLSSQKESRFKEIANYLENNFNESIKYENLNFIYTLEKRQSLKIGCPEEIAWGNNWIDKRQIENLSLLSNKNEYGHYLEDLVNDHIDLC